MSSALRWLRPIVSLSTGALLVGASSARAGQVPGSALAAARQTVPELLDSPAQAFLFPQRTVDGPSRLMSFAGGGGIGVTLAAEGRVAASVLAQSDRVRPNYYSEVPRILQAALAGGVGPLRFGAAYRDQRDKQDDVDDFIDVQTGEQSFRDSHSRENTRELAAGLGFLRGRGGVDLTAELVRLERQADGLRKSSYEDTDYSLTVLGQHRWGGAFLIAAPLGSSNLLRLAGAFRDRRADLHAVRNEIHYQSFDFQNPVYGHEWNAGLAFEHERGSSRSWQVHAAYSDVRDPGLPRGYSSGDLDMSRRELAEVGGSYQRPGWWGETQYFGARAYLTKDTNESTSFNQNQVERTSRFNERIDHSFSWGVSRSFGNLDLVGQVGTDLNIGSTFSAVDASLRF